MEIDGYNLIRSDRNRKGGGIACNIKTSIFFNYHGILSEKFENILTFCYLNPNLLRWASFIDPLTIIYRPADIANKELVSQGNETYFLGNFNIILFFEGHYVLKKNHTQNLKGLSQTKDF